VLKDNLKWPTDDTLLSVLIKLFMIDSERTIDAHLLEHTDKFKISGTSKNFQTQPDLVDKDSSSFIKIDAAPEGSEG
jgi:hypothetical protein